jgi:hypothetical protein
LAAFFGLDPNNWDFTNSELAVPTIFNPGTGGLSGTVLLSATTNTTTVPEPGTLGLLGGSLLALGLVTSWRRKRAARAAVAEDVAMSPRF